ncbi:ubiquitin-like superfamily protein [Wolffia australiana]
MENTQIFVKFLDGKTRCLQIPRASISGEAVKQRLFSITRIPLPFLRLVSGTREIHDDTVIRPSDDGFLPSFSLLLRLRGGKGGFGSLLRGAATKAGQKKTNNFDACRDMSGRRLRHVNAEKRLEEWKAEEENRKLEKLAEQFLKSKSKEVKKSSSAKVDKYIEKYKADSAKCMEEVEESVRQSFGLYEKSKRKALPASGSASKRLHIWMGKKKVEGSESESEDEEDDEDAEKSVVLDDGIKNDEGASMSSGQSEQEGSDGGSGKSIVEEEQGCAPNQEEMSSSGAEEVDLPQQGPVMGSATEELKGNDSSPAPLVEDFASEKTENESPKEPFKLENFSTAQELEVLGMDGLKAELQARGLKCGGTLQERAARLFLLKATPIEKLPKKLLAKPLK